MPSPALQTRRRRRAQRRKLPMRRAAHCVRDRVGVCAAVADNRAPPSDMRGGARKPQQSAGRSTHPACPMCAHERCRAPNLSSGPPDIGPPLRLACTHARTCGWPNRVPVLRHPGTANPPAWRWSSGPPLVPRKLWNAACRHGQLTAARISATKRMRMQPKATGLMVRCV